MTKHSGLQGPKPGSMTGPHLAQWRRRAASAHPVIHTTPIRATDESVVAANDEDLDEPRSLLATPNFWIALAASVAIWVIGYSVIQAVLG